MTCFAIVLGFLCCLHFVSYPRPCEGEITQPPDGSINIAVQGKDFKIVWKFNDPPIAGTTRQWSFQNGTASFSLGRILDDDDVLKKTDKLDIEITKPATLVLKNVDLRYNGTYTFTLVPGGGGRFTSTVIVFVAVTPTISANSSSLVAVDEGHAIYILCKGEGGNPPAEVTWTKDGVRKSGSGSEAATLVLENINENDNGTYMCVAESHLEAKNKTSIGVIVSYKPRKPQYFVSSSPPRVTLKCVSDGFPPPTYTFFYNGSVVTTQQKYVIPEVDSSNAGLYYCRAENRLGRANSDAFNVFRGTEAPISNKSNSGSEWYIFFVLLVSGVIIGILLSCLFVYSRRWFRNRKSQSNSQQETSKVDQTYQDLDLSKMNSEDNYQSLRVNSATNDADYENDLTYTELNKVRDEEKNYQALTKV